MACAPDPGPAAASMLSRGPGETEWMGSALADELEAGAVVLLVGELGAGKTVFAKGLARGLGVEEPVTSPTYTFVSEYADGRLPFYHLDLFRMGKGDPFTELGLDEYLYGDGVAAVEWPEGIEASLAGDRIRVAIAHEGGLERRIEVAAEGPRWSSAVRRFGLKMGRAPHG